MLHTQGESNAPHGVYQFRRSWEIDLATDSRHVYVDHVVERGAARRVAPDALREHPARHDTSLVPHQIIQQLELAERQVDGMALPSDLACRDIHLEIRDRQPDPLRPLPTPPPSPDP